MIQINPHARRAGVAALLVLTACGGQERTAVDLTSLTPLRFTSTRFKLDAAAKAERGVHLASLKGIGTLVGTAGGLYELASGKLKSLDKEAVVGLALIDDKRILVARAKRVDSWNGKLVQTTLFKSLDGSEITAVAAQGVEDLWIGTRKSLWRWVKQELYQFTSVTGGVTHIATYRGASQVVIRRTSGQVDALRKVTDPKTKKETWQLRTVAAAGEGVDEAAPATDGWYLARSGGDLLRGAYPDGDIWRRIALDGELQALGLDPLKGDAWAATAAGIYRLRGLAAGRAARPASLGTVSGVGLGSDGTLLLADKAGLYRLVVDTSKVPTWTADVKPFMEKNCFRCHGANTGVARPINTYELAKGLVDKIISQMEKGVMPADKKPLVGGDVTLIRRWKAGGTPR